MYWTIERRPVQSIGLAEVLATFRLGMQNYTIVMRKKKDYTDIKNNT